jgi:fibronectin-binding autotransporter adhesin
MKTHNRLLLSLFAALSATSAYAAVYDVATNFTSGVLWTSNSTSNATWNPTTDVPNSTDTITVAAGTVFNTGNNINVNGASRDIAEINYLNDTRALAFTQSGSIANLSINVSGNLTKDGSNASSTLAFVNIGLGGAGDIIHRNGGIIFTASVANTGGANLNTFALSKKVIFAANSTSRVPELTMRSASSNLTLGGTLNVTGEVNFGNTTATRVATFNLRHNANLSSTMNLNGNLTGSIGAKEVTFKIESPAATATSSRQTFSIGSTGTTNYTASSGSKFVVGRLSSSNSTAIVDLVNARAGGIGAVDTVQLGETSSQLQTGTADVRFLSSVADTLTNKVSVLSYGNITTGTQAFTVGGNHTTGLVTFSGAFTVGNSTTATNLTLLSSASGTTTAFTGGITANASPLSISGAGITALSGTITGNSTLTVLSGATLTPGSNGTNIGTLTFAGGQDLTLASGSKSLFQVTNNTTYDRITGIDVLTYGGTAEVSFASTLVGNNTFDLYGLASRSGSSVFDSLSISGSYSATLNAANSWTQTVDGNIFSFDFVTGDLTFAIPEPSSAAALAGVVTLGFVAARRRRRTA